MALHTRVRRSTWLLALAGLVGLAALLLATGLSTGTAQAQEGPECGDEIIEDTRLIEDLHCGDEHGLVVTEDAVTLDLGGNTISGDPEARDSQDRAGVRLEGVSGVTVANGTIEGFDAGVAVHAGGDNTVERLTVRDNVNYRVVTGENHSPDDLDFEAGILCLYGEGIAVFNSSGNEFAGNTVTDNGPLSGISLIGNSDDNVVAHNNIRDHDTTNHAPNGERSVCGGGHPDPDENPMSTGRDVQNIGVRVEGPDAERNLVEGNQVRRSALAGISVHGWNANYPDRLPPNDDTVIRGNQVIETGLRTWEDDEHAHGIAVLRTGPTHIRPPSGVTIEDNNASRNYGHGIYVAGRESADHVISGNVANHNRLIGILLAGPLDRDDGLGGVQDTTVTDNRANGNGTFDAADDNDGCGTNTWSGNRFHATNAECVGGGPGGSGDTPSRDADHRAGDGGPLHRHTPDA